jgi:ATP-dependent DNA helicase RecG
MRVFAAGGKSRGIELVIIDKLYHWLKIDDNLFDYLPRLLEIGIVAVDATGEYALRTDLTGAWRVAPPDADSTNDSLSDSIDRNDSINDSLNDSLTDAERTILELLKNNPKLTRKELAESTMIPVITVQRSMKSLHDKGLIERAGSKKSGYWKVKGVD